jgi:hypothetical protein
VAIPLNKQTLLSHLIRFLDEDSERQAAVAPGELQPVVRGKDSDTSVPKWGAESSLTGQWLPTAGGDGAWTARTGSGPMLMRGYIFAASRGGGAGC